MTARILSVAGSDSGGGAGIQADIRTITMMGAHAMTAITAITAQNTLGVTAVHPVPTDIVLAQIDACVSDIGVDAVKIGMIGSAETAHAVADRLSSLSVTIVFDPVMVATSGSTLADDATIAAFTRLMNIATVTTPNLPELNALGGEESALANSRALLIKGGHAGGDTVEDRLVLADGTAQLWSDPRIDTMHTHGTGCTLASGIATGLGQGMSLPDAITRARQFVRIALKEAPGLGAGHGPMGHHAVTDDAPYRGPALSQITLPCTDYDASRDFYAAIGLSQIVDSPANGYARFESTNGATLSIHRDYDRTLTYIECADVEALCANLDAAGYPIEQCPRAERWGWIEARLHDPAGNPLCLFHGGEARRFPPWRIAREADT